MSEHLFRTILSYSLDEQIRCLQMMVKFEQNKKHKIFLENQLAETMKKIQSTSTSTEEQHLKETQSTSTLIARKVESVGRSNGNQANETTRERTHAPAEFVQNS